MFSNRLERLLDKSLLRGPIENLRKEIGTGCIAIESVVFAIALFMRNRYHFKEGILEAVNSGGDADTIASMVGGMIGAEVGIEAIPKEWSEFSKEFSKAKVMGLELSRIGF